MISFVAAPAIVRRHRSCRSKYCRGLASCGCLPIPDRTSFISSAGSRSGEPRTAALQQRRIPMPACFACAIASGSRMTCAGNRSLSKGVQTAEELRGCLQLVLSALVVAWCGDRVRLRIGGSTPNAARDHSLQIQVDGNQAGAVVLPRRGRSRLCDRRQIAAHHTTSVSAKNCPATVSVRTKKVGK